VNSLRVVKELLLLARPQADQKGREEMGRGDGETNKEGDIHERYSRVRATFTNLSFAGS